MPDDTITIPVGGQGKKKMAGNSNTPAGGDLSDDCLELHLDSSFKGHEMDMDAISAGAEMAAETVRVFGAQKFGAVDPMEAVATEVALSTV